YESQAGKLHIGGLPATQISQGLQNNGNFRSSRELGRSIAGLEMDFVAIPHSSTPGIVWPALPSALAMRLLAILHQLEQSQWWSPALLERMQFRQLAVLVQHAWRTVPAYRTRLAEAGYTGQETVTREMWRRIPVLSRREVRQADTALHSASIPAGHEPLKSIPTSGSTGTPGNVTKTPLQQLYC